MPRERVHSLLFLLALSLLMTPWVHSLIKPYRLRVDMAVNHEAPTDIYLYHATNRKTPTDFKPEQVESMFVVPDQATRPPLALVRAMLGSARPITGLRIDPSAEPNDFQIGWLAVTSVTARIRLNAAELEPYVRAGEGISQVRLEGGVLHFRTTGNDPHFPLPLPQPLRDISFWDRATIYLFTWMLTAGALIFVVVVLGKHGLGLSGSWRKPVARVREIGARRAWGGLLLDVAAGWLALWLLLQFVAAYTHFDPSPLFHVLDDDGVGLAVPPEVRDMKALVRRHGHHDFVLADDMGKGDDESEIFQRAVEYLYPSRIVHRSEWVFGRIEGRLTPVFGSCRVVDKERLVVLYECRL